MSVVESEARERAVEGDCDGGVRGASSAVSFLIGAAQRLRHPRSLALFREIEGAPFAAPEEVASNQFARLSTTLTYRTPARRDASSSAAQVADRAGINYLIEEHDRKSPDHTNVLWSLIALDSGASVFLGASTRSLRATGAATGKMIMA